MRAAVVTTALLLMGSCTGESLPTSTFGVATTSTTAVPVTNSTTADLPACRPGEPRRGIDLEYDVFFDAYRHSRVDHLVELLGNGPVYDPWLDPDHDGHFPDLESWVKAGNKVTDRFGNYGYGFGEPFRIYSSRRNEFLGSHGIEEMTLTLDLWVNQDCELRVETHSPVASPDPCVLDTVFPDAGLDVCSGPFRPTSGQHAVWTGDEVLLVGGSTGTLRWRAKPSAFLFDPAVDLVRPVDEPPVDDGWYVHEVLWVDDHALVIGQPLFSEGRDDYRPSIYSYNPSLDLWTDVTLFPEELQVVGELVATGDDLIFIGGGQNQPSDQVWTYSLEANEWRHLEDAPIAMVEEAQAVWTGTEVIVVGGYAGPDQSLYMAYDPGTDTWRELPNPGYQHIEYHDLYWTGEQVIVAPMHVYTEERGVHNSLNLLLYNPATDTWSESSENPAQPPIRGAVSWTGSDLLFWGGFSSTWHATSEGSVYDPATDTWRLLSDSPLSARTDHSGTWTGSHWVIIGGSPDGGTPGSPSLSDGAIYDPATDTWEYLGD